MASVGIALGYPMIFYEIDSSFLGPVDIGVKDL